MAKAICPSCNKKLSLPDHLAGRRIICPHCGEGFRTSAELAEVMGKMDLAHESSEPEEPPFPPSARLGIAGMALGLVSILSLCLPGIGYFLSIGLSILGLLAALGGLLRARPDETVPLSERLIRDVGIPAGLGRQARNYSLAGLLTCFLALVLALAPYWFQ
jgi:hypothetical protein